MIVLIAVTAVVFTGFAAPASAALNTWTTHGPDGGIVQALAIDPRTPATLYAATIGAGVFKSVDGAGAWFPVNNGLPSPADVFSLAIDPTFSTTAYAGGQGAVFKTVDGGTTWTTFTDGIDFRAQIMALAIDPLSTDTLYAGTLAFGVLKSTDGGASWSAVNTGLIDRLIRALVIDPKTPSTVYAATGRGVAKSIDGGATWTHVGLSNVLTVALAIDPTTPSTLYASTAGFGVFKSTDGGATWNPTGLTGAVAFVFALAIDPAAPDIVYAGGGFVWKTTDAGATWTPFSETGTEPFAQEILALAIDPVTTSNLYVGTNGVGVSKSSDGGANWGASNAGLIATNNVALAIDPTTSATFYSATLRSGVFKTTDRGGRWTGANTGPTPLNDLNRDLLFALVIDPQTPTTLYAGGSGPTSIFKSADGGGSWSFAGNGLPGALIVTSLAIDPVTPTTLYAGTLGAGVFKTTDGAASWGAINAGLPASSFVQIVAVDPRTPTTVYAATFGGLFKSVDGGATWSATGLTQALDALAIDPATPTTLYAGISGGISKSTDGGTTWTAVNTGLPPVAAVALAIDPGTPTTLYAGMLRQGVFKSIDGGATWSALNTGLANRDVRALAVDPLSPAIVHAGTSGGVFSIEQSVDGIVTPAGGTVVDTSGTGATFSVGPGVLSTSISVSIDVIPDLGAAPPSGFVGPATQFVSFTLVPNPSPLPAPGATITLPLAFSLPPGTALSLFKFTPPSSLVSTGIVGTVNASGITATFSGVTSFSVFVGFRRSATIDGLIAQVASLALNTGQKNSLTVKLEAARRQAAAGGTSAARNQLRAFINEVDALNRSRQLPGAPAASLIQQAQVIIGTL